jgi:hypothetical protein
MAQNWLPFRHAIKAKPVPGTEAPMNAAAAICSTVRHAGSGDHASDKDYRSTYVSFSRITIIRAIQEMELRNSFTLQQVLWQRHVRQRLLLTGTVEYIV